MIRPQEIRITDYDYPLPDELIAQFPLEERDKSRLLVVKNGKKEESVFSEIDRFIPYNSLLIFNNTRVIRARLIFSRETGSTIEIFCLEPSSPAELQMAFSKTGSCSWTCLVGNVKRWKSGILRKNFIHDGKNYELRAELKSRLDDGCFLIEFSWDPAEESFSAILELAGLVPLPPYIERSAQTSDSERYQTIYAENEGSVAAPTAGLHFTPEVFEKLSNNGIKKEKVTLHVGLGTFRPVTAETTGGHVMHSEKISVSTGVIKDILKNRSSKITAVGTTTVRTLESIYWAGVKLAAGKDPNEGISQWDPYSGMPEMSTEDSLSVILEYCNRKGLEEFTTTTALMIVPGYKFRITDIMVTNFHQPQSTLLLLVSAFMGEQWKEVYAYAVEKKFRFLSYGDACLFFRNDNGI